MGLGVGADDESRAAAATAAADAAGTDGLGPAQRASGMAARGWCWRPARLLALLLAGCTCWMFRCVLCSMLCVLLVRGWKGCLLPAAGSVDVGCWCRFWFCWNT